MPIAHIPCRAKLAVMKCSHRILLGVLLAFAALAPAARAAEIIEAEPSILIDSTAPKPAVVTAITTPPPLAPSPSPVVLYLDLPDTVIAGRAFTVTIRAYDREGNILLHFQEPVMFECLYGIYPVVSRAAWRFGEFRDSVLIERPGRNATLRARAGEYTVSRYCDIQSEPWNKERWVKLADEHLAAGRTEAAIDALERASAFDTFGDPEIERRIANLYLKENRWDKAQQHFQRAVQAVINNLSASR